MPEDAAVVVDHAIDDVRRDADAAVRDRRNRVDDLQRRHADLLADRHRRVRERRPFFGMPDESCRLARQLDAGALAESETVDVVVEAGRADAEADADRADVRRVHHHLFEGEETVARAAVLVDRGSGDVDLPVAAVDDLRRSDDPFFESRRSGDDLERRSRLVHVLYVPVVPGGRRKVSEVIRVEGRE